MAYYCLAPPIVGEGSSDESGCFSSEQSSGSCRLKLEMGKVGIFACFDSALNSERTLSYSFTEPLGPIRSF